MRTIFKIIGFVQIVLFCYNYFFVPQMCFSEIDGPSEVDHIREIDWHQQTEQEIFFGPVETMPRFPGCEEDLLSKRELKTCADQKLLDFVHSNTRYPKGKESAEGMVIVQFNIEKDGSITDQKIMKDVAPGFGEEVIRVIHLMPKFIPGTQNGKLVKMRFTLPVRFRLE